MPGEGPLAAVAAGEGEGVATTGVCVAAGAVGEATRVGTDVAVAVDGGVAIAVGGTGVAVGGAGLGVGDAVAVGLDKTAVGAGLPLAWVGLGCAFGVAVGVGAANVEVGRPPSTATARAADRIQARIDQVDRDGAGRPVSNQAGDERSARRANFGWPRSLRR